MAGYVMIADKGWSVRMIFLAKDQEEQCVDCGSSATIITGDGDTLCDFCAYCRGMSE